MNKICLILFLLALNVLPLWASNYEDHTPFDRDLSANQRARQINLILQEHWRDCNLDMPLRASDAVFIRRVTLTACGRLPTASEARDFIRDDSPDKRARFIDRMLDSPEYAQMQAMRFADMLRIKSEFPINLWPNAVYAYHRKVQDDLANDRNLVEMFYEMLTVSGSNFRTPYANFFRASADRSPEGLAQMVLLTTMNMRKEALTEADFKAFAVLFSNIKYKSTYEWKEEIVYNGFEPQELHARLPDGTDVTLNTAQTDPRKVFADWLLKGDNDFFARAMTNKVWYWCFGRGIYPHADALPYPPDTWDRFWGCYDKNNVPFSEELQAYLIEEFNRTGSLKHLYRVIMNSAAFQASSLDQDEKRLARFASYPVRRLESEVLIDALASVTGGYDSYSSVIPEPFTFLPRRTKAITIADGSISTGVLDNFGRPPRDSGQFSERNTASTDSQSLYLQNSTALYRRINSYCGNIQRRYRDDDQRLEQIYLDILSRYPTTAERQAFLRYKQTFAPKKQYMVWSDTVWVLFNSKEFIFYH
ncbi:MAG: DUF1553 domain-containing protein [Lentisphaerae bacterium]|nr:DUF1553 domain-containing protein [Lentisphaerota bacterium]